MESLDPWKPVFGFQGIYEVSESGNIRSVNRIDSIGRLRRGAPMKIRNDSQGYKIVCLTKNAIQTNMKVHRLVLTAFCGPPESIEKNECAHLDGNPNNNNLWNLVWATRKQNARHMVLHGRSQSKKGDESSSAKLSSNDVHRIREAKLFGAFNSDLARAYGVSTGSIYLINKRINWSHI